MPHLYLHIGLPKSGSSAIQNYLADNAARLAGHGLRWVPGSRGPNCTELAVAFCGRDNDIGARYGVRSDAERAALRRRLADRLVSEVDHGDVIISSEHLAGMLRSPQEVAELAGFLHDVACHPKIIAVIRRADHWLPSAYAEAVRSGRDVRLGPAFVRRRAHLLDHQRLLDTWSAGFDEIRLIPFLESDKSDPAAMPRRFLEACGVEAGSTAGWSKPVTLSRQGLSATGVEVLRRVNPQLGLGSWHSGGDRERLVALLAARHSGPPVRLTPAARRTLDEHGWVSTGIDRSWAAFGSGWQEWRDTAPAPVGAPVEPSDAEVDATLAALRRAGFGAHRPFTTRARQFLQRVRH